MSVVFITCDRYFNAAGTSLPAAYIGNNVGDGYVYFNDFEYFRVWIGNDNYKGSAEIYYENKKRWIITQNIENIKVYNFNILGNILTSLGGTPYPIGGSGIEYACNWACAVADDPNCGYSWITRNGPNYDCSSLMYHAFYNAGFELPGMELNTAGTTYVMVRDFTSVGFQWITNIDLSTSSNLMRGDILLFEGDINLGTGHTGLYLGNGEMVEASWCEIPNWDYSLGDSQTGDQTGTEIYTHPYYNFPWDGILRYTGGNEVEII